MVVVGGGVGGNVIDLTRGNLNCCSGTVSDLLVGQGGDCAGGSCGNTMGFGWWLDGWMIRFGWLLRMEMESINQH